MFKDKFIIFFLLSILIHFLLFFSLNQNLFFKNTAILKKNKGKNITKIKFIDLPDKLQEKKHNEKTKYIAQKSFKAEKETKKDNFLKKSKPILPHKPKTVIIKDNIPTIPSNTVKQSAQKAKIKKHRNKNKEAKILKKKKNKNKNKKIKQVKNKTTLKIFKKKSIVSLNKITPTFQELLEKNLIPQKTLLRKPVVKKKKSLHTPGSKNKVYRDNDVQKLSPNIFQSSHIYPDDIDISDSVSISTQSSRFASYLHKVKRKIELVWEYPKIAGEMGIGGKLFIKFTINKTGKLEKIELLKSSGASILDREAVRSIKDASPYPPFPKDNSFGVNKIKIHACFEYVVSGKELW